MFLITGIGESRALKKHISCKCECMLTKHMSCKCECMFDGRKCNLSQK